NASSAPTGTGFRSGPSATKENAMFPTSRTWMWNGLLALAALALCQTPQAPAQNPGKKAAVRPKAGPESIRLLYFCSANDTLYEQRPDETDQAFAGRITGAFPLAELQARRKAIRAAWPTTQAAQDTAYLRKFEAEFGRELRKANATLRGRQQY